MFGNAFMNRMFRQVDGVVWDLMSGRLGIQTNEGIATLNNTDVDNPQIELNLFDDFGMAVPAFAQNTPLAQVNVGDLIVETKGILGWIVAKTDKSFTVMKPSGMQSKWTPPKVQMLGFDAGVMVLRSLMSVLPNGATGMGQMQSVLLPMMMMSEGDMDLSKIMPLMLFSQMGNPAATGDAAANPMGNMMQTMMMMQMMGGGGNKGSKPNFFDVKGSGPGRY
jgi:hypothetical protein